MLSGYVLTRTYHARFAQGLSAGKFMQIRVKRLWPVIAIGTSIGLFSQVDVLSSGEAFTFLMMGLAFMPYLMGDAVFPLNGAIWSIFFELFANILHATIYARVSSKVLLAVAVSMAAVMAVSTAYMGTFDLGSWGGNFSFGFARVILSYSIGCWLCLILKDWRPVGVSIWIGPIVLVSLILVGSTPGKGGWWFDFAFVTIACPMILIAGLGGAGSANRLGKLFGELSFPLYAIHVPVIFIVGMLGLHWLAAIIIALVVAVIVGLLTGNGTSLTTDLTTSIIPRAQTGRRIA
jgi:peptidoglycan/LPS O-acetylase OafA/YrhL